MLKGAVKFTLRIPHLDMTKSVSIPQATAEFWAKWRSQACVDLDDYDEKIIKAGIRADLSNELKAVYERGLHDHESWSRSWSGDGHGSDYFQSKLLTIVANSIRENPELTGGLLAKDDEILVTVQDTELFTK